METKQLFDLRADVAVMLVLREFGVKPRGALDRAAMVKSWPEYGLRASDLALALDRLQDRELVFQIGARDGDQVVLTDKGAAWANALPAWLEYTLVAPRRSARQLRLMMGERSSRPLGDRRRSHEPRIDRPFAAAA